MIARDKWMHFTVGAIVALAVAWYSLFLAFIAVIVVGAGKELFDSTGRGTVDAWDAIATLLGGIAVIGLFLL